MNLERKRGTYVASSLNHTIRSIVNAWHFAYMKQIVSMGKLSKVDIEHCFFFITMQHG